MSTTTRRAIANAANGWLSCCCCCLIVAIGIGVLVTVLQIAETIMATERARRASASERASHRIYLVWFHNLYLDGRPSKRTPQSKQSRKKQEIHPKKCCWLSLAACSDGLLSSFR